MASEENVKNLKEKIAAALAYQEKKLVNRDEWGKINFEEASADLDRIFSILSDLSVVPLENLPDAAVASVGSIIDQSMVPLASVDGFNLDAANPKEARNAAVAQVLVEADKLYTHVTPWIPYLMYLKGDVAKNIAALTGAVTDGKKVVEDAKEHIEERVEELDGIISTARDASAAGGATVFTKDFQNESEAVDARAKGWLWAAGAGALVTIGFAAFMFFQTGFEGKTPGAGAATLTLVETVQQGGRGSRNNGTKSYAKAQYPKSDTVLRCRLTSSPTTKRPHTVATSVT